MRLKLDNGFVIDFLKVSTIGDIAIIVYGPDELTYSYRASTGWIIGVDPPVDGDVP